MVLALGAARGRTSASRSLWAERELQAIRLGAARRGGRPSGWCAARCAATSRDAMVARIVERADGNAFYLEELIRAVAEGRGDDAARTGAGDGAGAPRRSRPEARRVLRAASVFGERFWRGGRGARCSAASAQRARRRLARRARASARSIARAPSARRSRQRGRATPSATRWCARPRTRCSPTTIARSATGSPASGWSERARATRWCWPSTSSAAASRPRAVALVPARAPSRRSRATISARRSRAPSAASRRRRRRAARGALRLVQAEAHVWRGELALAEARALEARRLLVGGQRAVVPRAGQAVIAAGKLGGSTRSRLGRASAPDRARGARSAQIVCLSRGASYLIFGGRYAAADELIERSIARARPAICREIDRRPWRWSTRCGRSAPRSPAISAPA